MKRRKKDPRENKNILHVTYGVVGVFAALTLYFGYFIQFRSEEVINNSYNARLNSFADRIVRGSILSDDGTALAETLVDESGGETRSYPYGSLFAHVVGYSGQNGKTGLEALGNFYLLSSHVNLAEKVFNELIGSKNVGDNIVTTLNLELQQVASDALGDRRGAVIVMEPDTGKVLAMDIQPAAVESTRHRLQTLGYAQARVVCDSHANLARYARPGTVDAAVFNLGYLPGGDHGVFTVPETSVPALRTALELLRPGGVLTVCAYSGGLQGTAERDAVLAFARALPEAQYRVEMELFSRRAGLPPVPVCIEKK